MKNLLYVLFLLPFLGCAGFKNQIAADGGIFGTYEGDYVVVNYSGNVIADVWVLRNVFVQSEEGSDGWRFRDSDGNVVFLGGDVKVMRMYKTSDMDKWHEYHSEFESQTYQSKFNK